MKGHNLGEFEELILLTVASLGEGAYAVSVRAEFNTVTMRNITISAVHSALYRLEEKGYLKSEFKGATQKRGGKKKRCFVVTQMGINALQVNKQIRETLWRTIPQLSFSAS